MHTTRKTSSRLYIDDLKVRTWPHFPRYHRSRPIVFLPRWPRYHFNRLFLPLLFETKVLLFTKVNTDLARLRRGILYFRLTFREREQVETWDRLSFPPTPLKIHFSFFLFFFSFFSRNEKIV